MTDDMERRAREWLAFEIVCPDGRVRHYPYHNEADARFDAALCSRRGCRLYPSPSPIEECAPPCPGGVHGVGEARETLEEAQREVHRRTVAAWDDFLTGRAGSFDLRHACEALDDAVRSLAAKEPPDRG